MVEAHSPISCGSRRVSDLKKVLAPHNEQDEWVYWRVRATTGKNAVNAPGVNPLWLVRKDTLECVKASDIGIGVGYADDTPGSRIISSRRVERAVEQDDFLKLCADEGLFVGIEPWGEVKVQGVRDGYFVHHGKTLREAYYRYHASVGDTKGGRS